MDGEQLKDKHTEELSRGDRFAFGRNWRRIKKLYGSLPWSLQYPAALSAMTPGEIKLMLKYLLTPRPHRYLRHWSEYQKRRGMSRWHNHVDWLGGYPFEVARPEEIIECCREGGLLLERLRTVRGGSGCNQFVFSRTPGNQIGETRTMASSSYA